MSRIRVTPHISLDENELEESFIQSSGPGGQNVNKVASAVQLRFDARRSPSLSEDVHRRLIALAGHRATKNGVIVLTARESCNQKRNRAGARERLLELIRRAAIAPKKRKATKPTKASKERRIEHKKARAKLKRLRDKRIKD